MKPRARGTLPPGAVRQLWLAALLLAIFCALAALIGTGALAGPEAAVYDRIAAHMSPALTAFLRTATRLGNPLGVISVLMLLLILPVRRTLGIPACATVLTSTALTELFKRVFARPRPDLLRLIPEKGFSFPSGHATNTMALYLTLLLLLLHINRHKRHASTLPLCVLCAVLPLLIGFSRVYLGVHYAGDVLAGWVLGAAVALASTAVWKTLQ